MSSSLKISTFCLLVTCAGPALAQAQVAESQSSVEAVDAGGDIVVTAQKRADRAQDVPISLGVLSGDQLTASKVTNATQLAHGRMEVLAREVNFRTFRLPCHLVRRSHHS